jgi:hypothetical protein
MYGNDWHKISTIVTTRTFTQIQTHAQKYHAKNNAEVQQKYPTIPHPSSPNRIPPWPLLLHYHCTYIPQFSHLYSIRILKA